MAMATATYSNPPPPSSPPAQTSTSTGCSSDHRDAFPSSQREQSLSLFEHREWLHGHLLSTGLYQHLLRNPEQFTFFWTQGSGLLISSAATILFLTVLDVSRQILMSENSVGEFETGNNQDPAPARRAGNCRKSPMAYIVVIYSGILLIYVLIQSFPALLARIVEADADTKVEAGSGSAATLGRRPDAAASEQSHPPLSEELPTPTEQASGTVIPSDQSLPLPSAAEGDRSPSYSAETSSSSSMEERYTDIVLQEHLRELLIDLFSGSALDDIPDMRDTVIGDFCRITTPAVIRALECYEYIPYVLYFAVVQLTTRRLFVNCMAVCMRVMRLRVSLSFGRGLVRSMTERVLENVIPAMIPAAVKLSAKDIWRTKKVIVEVEMGLHEIGADAESLVVKDFRSLLAFPDGFDVIMLDDGDLSVDDDRDETHHLLEVRDLMMRASITVFDITLSTVEDVLQKMSFPAVHSTERGPNLLQNLQSFRAMLLLVRLFYIAPYKANLQFFADVENTDGEPEEAALRRRQQRHDHAYGAVLKNLEVMLGGEDYWDRSRFRSQSMSRSNQSEGGDGACAAAGGRNEAETPTPTEQRLSVDAAFKAPHLVAFLLLCLVHPPSENAPEVEALAAECVYNWVEERKKRTVAMYDPTRAV